MEKAGLAAQFLGVALCDTARRAARYHIGSNLSADRFHLGENYYKIRPGSRGRGYATEAAEIEVQFGFKQLHLHRIEAGVATENKASLRVLEKPGRKQEGMKRKILPTRGQWKDNFPYALLEGDER